MRIFCRLVVLASVVAMGFAGLARGQVLARPGWAGSGVTPEPWWRRAVFYRVHPELFQDSDGDGRGDLKGLAERLGYVQQLGVDAMILAPPFERDDFAELVRKASEVHLRVLVELEKPDAGLVRFWLNQGAAGVYVDPKTVMVDEAATLKALRKAVDSVPGERVLIGPPVYSKTANDGPQLTLEGYLSGAKDDAGSLRRQIVGVAEGAVGAGVNPVLELRGTASGSATAEEQAILDRTLAAMLMGSRVAVIFDAGRELGLRSADGKETVMQWTPTDVTPKPDAAPVAVKAGPKVEVYGAYTPYVPPLKIAAPPPVMPKVVETFVPPPPDPMKMPGFTSGALPADVAVNGAAANAATEDAEGSSLLNFYRHLIAMHHGNFSLRNGAQVVVDEDEQDVLAWVRKAPAGAATAANVVVACNLSSKTVEVDLSAAMGKARVRGGMLRALLTASSSKEALPVETVGKVVLPGGTVFVGEVR